MKLRYDSESGEIHDEHDHYVLKVPRKTLTRAIAHETACEVVRAANTHEALLAVVETLLWQFPDLDEIVEGRISQQNARNLLMDARDAVNAVKEVL